MTEITLAHKNAKHFRDLFFPFSIGYDDFFDRLNTTAETHQSSGFPPYNVIRNEGKTYVEIALAGYKRSNLERTFPILFNINLLRFFLWR